MARTRPTRLLRALAGASLAALAALGALPSRDGGEAAARASLAASPVAIGDDAAILEFERHYDLAVGDKGEDRFELPEQPPSCDGAGLAFDSAEIVYVRRRFGEAQVVATPEPGCVRCGPVVVRRYHEPTGELAYRLRVHRRKVTLSCSDGEP